jgi:hypothetical protein
MYGVRMSGRRRRRRSEKRQRHASRAGGGGDARAVVRKATHVERLAYTRQLAAEALGISTSTFNRRVLPFIETLQMEWGTRLIPVDELERFLTERRQRAPAERRRPAPQGRKPGLPPEVVARIRSEHRRGKSLGDIARGLNADAVRTSQGGSQWWPSTVRAVLIRSNPTETGRATTASA